MKTFGVFRLFRTCLVKFIFVTEGVVFIELTHSTIKNFF